MEILLSYGKMAIWQFLLTLLINTTYTIKYIAFNCWFNCWSTKSCFLVYCSFCYKLFKISMFLCIEWCHQHCSSSYLHVTTFFFITILRSRIELDVISFSSWMGKQHKEGNSLVTIPQLTSDGTIPEIMFWSTMLDLIICVPSLCFFFFALNIYSFEC